MNRPSRGDAISGTLAIGAFVYFALISLSYPYFAGTGLDASWSLSITEAALHHLRFGHDFVFTYGPLGYLIVGSATPETFHALLLARVGLALTLASLVAWTSWGPLPIYRKIVFLIVMAIAVEMTLADVQSMPGSILVLALCLCHKGARRLATLALVFGLCAGILGLMKFTNAIDFGVGIGGALLVGAAFDRYSVVARRERLIAFATFVSSFFATSAVTFAADAYGPIIVGAGYVACIACLTYVIVSRDFLAGKTRNVGLALVLALFIAAALSSSNAFREFVGTSMQLALGYSSAMATAGPPYQLVLALLLLALLALVAIANRSALGWGVTIGIVAVSWLTFKEGFVRQDGGHVFGFYTAACLIFAVLVRYARPPLLFGTALLAFSVSMFALSRVYDAVLPGTNVGARLWSVNPMVNATIIGGIFGPGPAKSSFSAGLAPDILDARDRERIATMAVDVQPWESGIVFANNLRWQPEPVFQSYVAFTPALDLLNADDLLSKPRRILYQFNDIDGREPFGEAPLERQVLLCNYHLDPAFGGPIRTASGSNPYLVLVPEAGRCSATTLASPGLVAWNVETATPPAGPGDLILARIRPRLTPLGIVVRALFRAPSVYVTFSGAGGLRGSRILPDQSPDGILVDPLPSDTETYAALDAGTLPSSTTSLRLSSDDSWLYAPQVDVTFVRLRRHEP